MLDQLQDLESVEFRHLDVKKNEVGLFFRNDLDRLKSVGTLGRDFDFGVTREMFANDGAGELFIVHNDRFDLLGGYGHVTGKVRELC